MCLITFDLVFAIKKHRIVCLFILEGNIYFTKVFMHTFLFQAIKLEKILHDRNSEIDALKSRLKSELSCTEEGEVMNTPPPKVFIKATNYF